MPERDCYLDYNATTPVDTRVLGAFDRSCRRNWGNPSSLHGAGLAALNQLDENRRTIADWLKCDSEGIFFCSSGSEALHAGLTGFAFRNPEYTILTTKIEHSAVLHPVYHLSKAGHQVHYLAVDEKGQICPDSLINGLESHSPCIFIYSPVNHETGSQQDSRSIFETVKHVNDNNLVIIDGVQAAARIAPEEWVPYCDIFAISGHKLYAPKGTALLWKKGGLRMRPFRFGGGQENGFFPGTENTVGIAAFASAVELMTAEATEERKNLTGLINDLLYLLKNREIEFIRESPDDAVPGVVNLSFPQLRNPEDFLFSLNSKKVYISRFSACSSGIDRVSSVLQAMGRSEIRSRKSFRICLGRFSKREDLYRFVDAVADYLN